jgi:hypothetical protein
MNTDQLSMYQTVAKITRDSVIRSETHAKAARLRFNVFSCLLKENDEVRLHTRFLHCLLNPEGYHDCGSLFLDLFFEMLKDPKIRDGSDNETENPILLPKQKWAVKKETRRGDYGQIDLLIECKEFGIAIENKIDAKEQHEQLFSYADYLESQYGKYGERHLLIYLTLDGKKGYTAGSKNYIRISYARHVLAWIEECLKATYQFPPINQVLIQYRSLVMKITHQNFDTQYMNPIVEFIRKNPDIVRLNGEIQMGITRASAEAWGMLQQQIADHLCSRYKVVLAADGVEFCEPGFAALSLKPIAESLFQGAAFDIRIEREEDCLGIGIYTNPDQNSTSSQLNPQFIQMREHISAKSNDRGLRQSDRTNSRFPVGWHNLLEGSSDQVTADLLEDPKGTRICDEIDRYLILLEEAFIRTKTVQNSSKTEFTL